MNKSNSSEEKELPLYKETEVRVPIHLKITLTIREAAEYSNIGINKIDSMLKQPNCPFFDKYLFHTLCLLNFFP